MKIRPVVVAEAIFLSFVLFLANIRSTIFWSPFPPVDTIFAPAWRETLLWLFTMFLLFYLLAKQNLTRAYLQAWKKQPLLIAFVLFSILSISWSTDWQVTLHRVLAFTFGTASAFYLGVRYSMGQWLRTLTLLGIVILVSSCLLVFLNTELGTSPNWPYYGAWRGIFWHKNQLGNILPIFTLVFMVRLSSLNNGNTFVEKTVTASAYILSLVVIFFAKSASGYIIVILLHLVFVTAFLWLKVKHLLRPTYYYAALAILLAACAVVWFNLDFVFGLFGKQTHLTGRVPMWGILFREVFPLHPWLGQGFGTIWANIDFRLYMRDAAGWYFPIMIGDNGFIDILLNLGVVGLALFLLNYAVAWVASTKCFLRESSLKSFFPPAFMLYTFLANLTFSLFMETEIFVWVLMVAQMVLVSAIRTDDGLTPAAA